MMLNCLKFSAVSCVLLMLAQVASAGVGDPQIRTDHPWYPGELSCSSFERLFQTQAALFQRVTGRTPETDEDRVLAAWMWRNLNYAHGEEGAEDLWGQGFRGGDTTTREYWSGLFAHGFGLCGTTHAQWSAELNALLGHGRSRTAGVIGHNACEVFLKGGPYGSGQWALLDHDVSTVIFDPAGIRLLSIDEISRDLKTVANPKFNPQRQHGWPIGGLHPDDPQAYAKMNVVEHLPGYAGPPPMIYLRRGETLRRYFHPGLEDGKTYVFWGRNYRAGGIPGLERSRTWVNQPEKFFSSSEGSGFRLGQARYGNAVYTYKPSFADDSYREGVISEGDGHVTFEFQTPYIIAATPPDDSDWGIYEPGGRNGLVVHGVGETPVTASVDRGASWHTGTAVDGAIDLTDVVKGHRQYWLRLAATPQELVRKDLKIMTVCQANSALFPRLKENGSTIQYEASNQAVVSAGPNLDQARQQIIEGAFETPRVTLQLEAPRNARVTRLYAAAHIGSSNPPDPEIAYQIEYSTDSARSWKPVVQDWRIVRQGNEPRDFWSQSFCYGELPLEDAPNGPVQVRFRNNGGKRYLRAEAHLAYAVPGVDQCQVTFSWSDSEQENRTAQHVFDSRASSPWMVSTGSEVRMHWVEFAPVPGEASGGKN